jgi:hypothetical protein
MEVDEAMRLIMEKGGVKGIVAKKDALHETLEKVQAQLLASEKEVTRLEGTRAQHFANYIKLSQKVKTAKLLMSITNHVKLVLDNWVQTLERELVQKVVSLMGVQNALKEEQKVHQALKDKPLLPETYDDVVDQWVLDKPKVFLYKDFIQIGKLITTKSYTSMKDSLIKVSRLRGQYRNQIQDL